jgi:hypothetical protein
VGDILEESSAWCTDCATTWEGVEVRVLAREVETARVKRAQAVRARREAEQARRHAEESDALLDIASSVG